MAITPYIDIHTHNRTNFCDAHSIVNCEISDLTHATASLDSCSVGIHPWDISKIDVDNSLKELAKHSKHLAVVAIGEIGLDRLATASLPVQEEIFSKQLQIAEETRKPVIIHCVKCFAELVRIRKKIEAPTTWIIHGFHKNGKLARQLLDLGCYLSFGKALFGSNNVQKVFKNVPDHRFFLETDDSGMSIKEIYQRASELKNIALEPLKNIITANYKTCFNDNEQRMAEQDRAAIGG